MTWTAVCDAWAEELQLTVPALAEVIVHRYAPYSVEALEASVGERHLAVWPEGEAEVATPLTTRADLMEQSYLVLIWEDASEDATRRRDNEEANADWLDLHEAVRARFTTMANVSLGEANLTTRYVGAAFEMIGGRRVLTLRFRVRLPITYQ